MIMIKYLYPINFEKARSSYSWKVSEKLFLSLNIDKFLKLEQRLYFLSWPQNRGFIFFIQGWFLYRFYFYNTLMNLVIPYRKCWYFPLLFHSSKFKNLDKKLILRKFFQVARFDSRSKWRNSAAGKICKKYIRWGAKAMTLHNMWVKLKGKVNIHVCIQHLFIQMLEVPVFEQSTPWSLYGNLIVPYQCSYRNWIFSGLATHLYVTFLD